MSDRLVFALAALMIISSGCSRTSRPDRALPPPPAEVTIILDEYQFRHPRPVPAGRVVFRVVNQGALEHELTLVPLGDDVPPVDEQIRSRNPRLVTPLARVPPRQPNQTGSFAADLAAGQRYGLVCYVRNPDGQNHASLGMSSEFRAGQ